MGKNRHYVSKFEHFFQQFATNFGINQKLNPTRYCCWATQHSHSLDNIFWTLVSPVKINYSTISPHFLSIFHISHPDINFFHFFHNNIVSYEMASRTSCIAAFMVCLCIQIIRTCILPAFPQFCLFNIPFFALIFSPSSLPSSIFYLLSSCFIRAFRTQLPQFSPP